MKEAFVPSYVDELIAHSPFEYSKETEELFRQAMVEAFAIHYDGSEDFRRFVNLHGYDSPKLKDDFELEELPSIFVNVFKERDLITGSRDDVVLELTSSGTGGRKSRNFLDQTSLDRIKLIARKVYDGLDMVADDEKVNYICFSYDPHVANDLGTAFTDDLLTSFTSVAEVFYAIRWKDELGDFHFDVEETMKRLDDYGQQDKPLRFLGFPAFIHRLLNLRRERGMATLNLGPSSWAMTGGGWKTHEGEAISREEFAARLENEIGIPAGNVRDLFGMVEHGIPYVQCEKGRFHVPLYSYPIIRHPLTLNNQPDGEAGLLQLMTPYWTSYPALSVLTSDLAKLHGQCDCGRLGKTLEIVGRGGVKKHKGCAIQAAELLR